MTLEKRLREIVANCALGHGSLRDSELVSDAYRAGQRDERARCVDACAEEADYLETHAPTRPDGDDPYQQAVGARKCIERIEKGRR